MEVGAVGPNFERDTHLITISAIFCLIWLSGLRGEDLNVKIYDGRRMDGRTYERRTSSDVKSSTGLSPGELKMDRRLLDLQLPVQSVPITTNIVNSNPVDGELYSIQHYVMKFVRSVVFPGYFHFLHQ